MKNVFVGFTFGLLSLIAHAQESRVMSWNPPDPASRLLVYHPEPILFVHGINDNDGGWMSNAIPSVQTEFLKYDLPDGAIPLTGVLTNQGYNAAQTNFLHTLNYGDPPGVNTTNQQSFETIRWNAWEGDMQTWPLINIFLTNNSSSFYIAPAPNDNRMTLDRRIAEIRTGYRIQTNTPNLVVVAHSMGGLLAHYLPAEEADRPRHSSADYAGDAASGQSRCQLAHVV